MGERMCIVAQCPQCLGWVHLDASDCGNAETLGTLAVRGYQIVHKTCGEARRMHICDNAYAAVPCHKPHQTHKETHD